MKIDATDIAGLYVITPQVHEDARGAFSEVFRLLDFSETTGHNGLFVQENHSVSHHKNTIRGLHIQLSPDAQGKLVRCNRGRIWDVAVDVRKASPTYKQAFGIELSAENRKQLWVPRGFLHGFRTLEDHAEVIYKCDSYYAPQSERSVLWNDSDLAIDWAGAVSDPVLSEKDAQAQSFSSFTSTF